MTVKSSLKLVHCNYELYKGMIIPDQFILVMRPKQQKTHIFNTTTTIHKCLKWSSFSKAKSDENEPSAIYSEF